MGRPDARVTDTQGAGVGVERKKKKRRPGVETRLKSQAYEKTHPAKGVVNEFTCGYERVRGLEKGCTKYHRAVRVSPAEFPGMGRRVLPFLFFFFLSLSPPFFTLIIDAALRNGRRRFT